MKCLAIALGAVVGVAADCQSTGTAAIMDPYFGWLVTGTNAQRRGNVTAICASANNTARTNFYDRLDQLITDCVPAGTDVSTSALGITVSLLNKVICEQKSFDYCLLSLLPLFDATYFLSLSQGAFTVPPLAPVANSVDRQTALCASGTCNSYIASVVPSLLTDLPASSAATAAADFIRGTVSRLQCGCTGSPEPCYSSNVTDELIANGALVEAKACEPRKSLPTECARIWMTCENVSAPKCAKPCSRWNAGNIQFVVANLDYDCFIAAGNALVNIKKDLMINIPGLLKEDLDCKCNAAVAPDNGTACSCALTCNLGGIVDLGSMSRVDRFARAGVLATPTLDKLVPQNCKLTANSDSFGASFESVSSYISADDEYLGEKSGAASSFFTTFIAITPFVSTTFSFLLLLAIAAVTVAMI